MVSSSAEFARRLHPDDAAMTKLDIESFYIQGSHDTLSPFAAVPGDITKLALCIKALCTFLLQSQKVVLGCSAECGGFEVRCGAGMGLL